VSHDAIEGSKNWWPISEFLLAVLPDDGTELKP
jgi:hypothetical protein